jgi:hypothetical protein
MKACKKLKSRMNSHWNVYLGLRHTSAKQSSQVKTFQIKKRKHKSNSYVQAVQTTKYCCNSNTVLMCYNLQRKT